MKHKGRSSMVGGGKLFVQSLNKWQEVGKLNVFGEVQIVFNKLKHEVQGSCGRKSMGVFFEQDGGGFE